MNVCSCVLVIERGILQQRQFAEARQVLLETGAVVLTKSLLHNEIQTRTPYPAFVQGRVTVTDCQEILARPGHHNVTVGFFRHVGLDPRPTVHLLILSHVHSDICHWQMQFKLSPHSKWQETKQGMSHMRHLLLQPQNLLSTGHKSFLLGPSYSSDCPT